MLLKMESFSTTIKRAPLIRRSWQTKEGEKVSVTYHELLRIRLQKGI